MQVRRGGCLPMLALCGITLSLAGCPITGTTHGTTDTLQNSTISTSGHGWLTEDGLVKERHKLHAFAAFNLHNLQQDLARREGEYLSSFAQLAGISSQTLVDFTGSPSSSALASGAPAEVVRMLAGASR